MLPIAIAAVAIGIVGALALFSEQVLAGILLLIVAGAILVSLARTNVTPDT